MEATSVPPGLFWRMKWWWRGRDRRAIVSGAPALLAALTVATFAILAAAISPRDLQARYSAEGKAALQSRNFPHALTCYERAAALAPDDAEVTYRLALAAEVTGDLPRAASLMRALAPDSGRGYPPAHAWRARQLLLSGPPTPRVEAHLIHALEGEIDDREGAHGLLGTVYLSAGRLDDAEPHLVKAVAARSLFRLPLARLYYLKGDPTRARQEVALAVRYHRDRARAEPSVVTHRLAWADATTYLDDFLGAVAILEDGLSASGDPVYRLALAKVYAGWYDWRKKQSASQPELIGLIDKGLSWDAANRDLLTRLVGELRLGGTGADAARQILHGLLAKGGPGVAPVHFALAVDARLRGDKATETLHLERALALDPKAPFIANNLACVLAEPPTPDLPRALALAEMAVERDPNNPTFRDTRGRIRLALGRPPEALSDLDFVLRHAPETPGLHAALADTYEKLNQPGLASEHRTRANQK